jgi:predicted enzyme related to lactoylglutathione lyase
VVDRPPRAAATPLSAGRAQHRAAFTSLTAGACHDPPRDGARVCLDAGPSIDAAIGRVAAAGGRVVLPKTALPPGMGDYAHIEDSEGIAVDLHALN